MKKLPTNYEIMASIRKTWGNVKPATKVFKSKKTYNRADKSWKNLD